MLTEEQKEKVRGEAREILGKFGKSLKEVKMTEEGFKKKAGGYRSEGQGLESDGDFRKRMFDNAPEKEGDCLIAEKKKW